MRRSPAGISRSTLKRAVPANVRRLARFLGLGGQGPIRLVIQGVVRRLDARPYDGGGMYG